MIGIIDMAEMGDGTGTVASCSCMRILKEWFASFCWLFVVEAIERKLLVVVVVVVILMTFVTWIEPSVSGKAYLHKEPHVI